jgi:FtsP/CotA-like multicopper oxidase with cupredoxin domain
MNRNFFKPSRRAVLTSLGLGGVSAVLPARLTAAESPPPNLTAKAGDIVLRPGQAASPAWTVEARPQLLRFRRGTTAELGLANELPGAVAFGWRGLGRVPTSEPLTGQPALAPGGRIKLIVPVTQSGTGLCDIRLLADGAAAPARGVPLIVDESEPVNVDRDEIFLIEDWRVKADGAALPPGIDPRDAATIFTANGASTVDIPVRRHQRIRLRFINGCQRMIVAVKIADLDVRVMAIDGQPAEPFSARNGALVLPPGGRTDVFIDIPATAAATTAILLHDGTTARPIGSLVTSSEPPVRSAPLPPAPALPGNGLPDKLELKGAARVELALDGTDWVPPQKFSTASPPAFQAKIGRVAVLALTNRARTSTVFHLHGHHFRLLDRLDDGWKPYWLDTLALEPGQTQRIAFAAETPGRFLIESMATDWAAPRLVRCYEVR